MDVSEQLAELLNRQTKSNDLVAEAINLLSKEKLHTKTPADFGTYTEMHGVGSLFGSQSVERDVITAHIRPRGIGGALPTFGTVFEQPYFASLTGVTDDIGSEPVNPCDDAPSGYIKGCNLSARFGRVAKDSQTIEINKVMLRRNRGDFTDLLLRGRLLGEDNLSPSGLNEQRILDIVTQSEMVQMGVRMERSLSRMIWQGNPANDTAGGGYKEFPGLDRQVATGQVDAETGTACPALDSDVKSFNYNAVDGSSPSIVTYMSALEFYLRSNAENMGLDPVEWVWVMRPELWQELSAVWPCQYLTHRCVDSAGGQAVVLNDETNVRLRDAMRNGMFIDVNGRRYPVITDVGIFEHNNVNNGNLGLGQYASSIFFLPMTITGGFPVLYWEHVDYSQAATDMGLLRGTEEFWTDDGRWFWAVEYIKWCLKLSVKIEPRIVLRTPQLAGRIDSVRYEPLQHIRSPFPDSEYFQDGGVSVRPDETVNAVWL